MEAVKTVSAEIVGWGVAGWELFSIPGLSASPRVRVVVAVLALLVAASAVPISNAVIEALW
jgi:hypothetical protein